MAEKQTIQLDTELVIKLRELIESQYSIRNGSFTVVLDDTDLKRVSGRKRLSQPIIEAIITYFEHYNIKGVMFKCPLSGRMRCKLIVPPPQERADALVYLESLKG